MAIDKITASGLGDGGVSTADLADGAVSLAKLSATGTKNNTTFLRGDNTFSALSTTLAGLDDATVNTGDPVYNSNVAGASVGHIWVNSTSGEVYVLTDATNNLNVWTNIGDGTGTQNASYNISDILVVAGGGGGGARGGGGAGGMLQAAGYSILTGNTITATVGGGGDQGSAGAGNDGGNSSLATNGGQWSTLTAIGGGGGGSGVGRAGGSGGGGDYAGQAGGAGTAGQGNAGGVGSSSQTVSGGGGGGKSAAGSNGVGNSSGGAGGAGLADSITGSSVTYAGGGGGGSETVRGGEGGAGGGGRGVFNGGSGWNAQGDVGDSGTPNTGGGGGGSYSAGVIGGHGGSGVVIIVVPTARYSGTTTGSPTVTTVGANKVIKFTSSGTYTAQETNMAYFAKVSSDGTVLDVIVADQDFIDNNTESSDDHSYIETFMDADGKSKKYNYASRGHMYNSDAKAFHKLQPYASWTLNTTTYLWEAPVAYPSSGNHEWDEGTQRWVEVTE